VPATEYYDVKNKIIAYMDAVYAATNDAWRHTYSKEFGNASRIRT